MTAIPEATQRRLDDLAGEIERLTACADELQTKAAATLAQANLLKAQRCTTLLTLKEAGVEAEAQPEKFELAPPEPAQKRHPVARLAKQMLDSQGFTSVSELTEKFGIPWPSAEGWAKRALNSGEITIADGGVIRYAANQEVMGAQRDE